jgi:drug/metabolite transporter (DMT)-like permease
VSTTGTAAGRNPGFAFIATSLASCSLFWASSFLFIKLMDGALPPLAIAAARGVIGGLTLALWFILSGRSIVPRRDELRHWLVLGTLNGWVPNVLVAYALLTLAVGKAAMIQASGPLMTAIIAHLAFSDERLTQRRLAGVLTGLAGMALLVGPKAMEGGASLLAVLAMVGVTLCYAIGNAYAKTAHATEPSRLALGQQVVSGLAALGITLAIEGWPAFAKAQHHLWALLALGVFSTAIPITIYMRLIREAGPTRAAMTGYLMPMWATLLGVAVLNERLGQLEITGGIIVLIGVYVVTTAKPGKARVGP